jgi:hypothetical protein
MLGYEENRAVDIVFGQVRANDTQPRLFYDRRQVSDWLDAQLQAVSFLLGDDFYLHKFVLQTARWLKRVDRGAYALLADQRFDLQIASAALQPTLERTEDFLESRWLAGALPAGSRQHAGRSPVACPARAPARPVCPNAAHSDPASISERVETPIPARRASSD